MKLKSLSLREFNQLAERTELKEKARGMARSVLVDGRSYPEVARDNGVTKQRVAALVARIEREYVESGGGGQAWVNVEIDIPKSLAQKLSEFLIDLKSCKDSEQKSTALAKAARGLALAKKTLESAE